MQISLAQYEKLNQENTKLEKGILQLSKYAIEQSNGYINNTAKRLADEAQRESVTKLQRLVIIGALDASNSQYDLQLCLQQVKQHVQEKENALAYI